MEYFPKNRYSIKQIKGFIIVLYVAGFLGFIIPFTAPIFKSVTPLALLLCTYFLALYHKDYSRKSLWVFGSIFLMGWSIEAIGVNTGQIFGSYYYGKSFGLKVLQTPLLIGVNWLFLSYTTTSLVNHLKLNNFLKIPLAALLMVGYDGLLEQVCETMDMWYWNTSTAPLQNYLVWFAISMVFVSLIQFTKINTKNKLSAIVFICQICFLLGIFVFNKL